MYRNAERSLTALHKAFEELLLTKPVARISVTDVAKRANLTRNTFYSYYSSLDDLSRSFFRRERRLTELLDAHHTVFDVRHPTGLVAACSEYIYSTRQHYAELLTEYKDSPNYQWIIASKIRNVYEALIEYMTRQKIRVEEKDRRFVSFTVIIAYSLMYQHVVGDLDVSQEQFSKSFLAIVQAYCTMLIESTAPMEGTDPMLVFEADISRDMRLPRLPVQGDGDARHGGDAPHGDGASREEGTPQEARTRQSQTHVEGGSAPTA
ncbi:MAG: TetR/AcrR family transcriptional regulator [Bifidobacteriaceae bacterium]|nr:TetR/AcrR family transcriptional regulator [Bifidobacteriaceae bacterium]